jgi:dihydroneopterin aldolase
MPKDTCRPKEFNLSAGSDSTFQDAINSEPQKNMLTVELQNIILHAYHGIYAGEPSAGGDFEISLRVLFEEEGRAPDKLSDTVNYVRLYEIVKKRMQHPTHLLEKICEDIMLEIRKEYPFISEAHLSIYKLQAPVENFQGKLGVTLSRAWPTT